MRMPRSIRLTRVVLALGLVLPASGARADDAPDMQENHARAGAPAAAAPTLRPGAIELGLAGSMTAIDGLARATLHVRSGLFLAAGPVLAGLEPEVVYSHVRGLDAVDLALGVSAQRRLGATSLYAHFALGGGVRQEWLGSFSQARYPVGGCVGFIALYDPRAAVRIEYRLRRVLDDPVADFTEHEVLAGISLLFRNAR
jgi:hypothetical protein